MEASRKPEKIQRERQWAPGAVGWRQLSEKEGGMTAADADPARAREWML